jgi:hypothetical protein
MPDPAGVPPEEPQVDPAAALAAQNAELLQRVRSMEGREAAHQAAEAKAKAAEADLTAARAQLAEYERSQMSALELAQRERDEAKAAAAQAQAKAARVEMGSKYPHAAAKYGDEPLPSEAVLATLESALIPPPPAAPAAPATPPPPNVARPLDTNPAPQRASDLLRQIDEQGRSELPDSWFGGSEPGGF